MAAQRPTANILNKQNVNPSINRLTEATAEDFKEIGQILLDHAIIIDDLDRAGEQSEFYGFFSSLPILQATHPTAIENAFAVIDPGTGDPQRIATYSAGTWTMEELSAPIQFYTTKTARPTTGQSGIWYIVLDEKIAYLWHNGAYIGFGKDGSNGLDAYEVAVALGFVGTRQEWIDSIKESLEFVWQGTSLGVRKVGDAEYVFADLQGPPGEPGQPGEPGAGFENIPATANQIPVTDGTGGINWEEKPTGGGGTGSGVTKRYLTWAALLADQATQVDLGVYYVADASAHSTVDAGFAYFEYLGTTNGTESDYRKLSEQESMDVDQSSSYEASTATYTNSLLFDNIFGKYLEAHTQTGAISFTKASTGNLIGGTIHLVITTDGDNPINFDSNFDFIYGTTSGGILPAGVYEFYFVHKGNGKITVNIPSGTSEGGMNDTTAPSTPTNVKATNITETSATVSWNASTDS